MTPEGPLAAFGCNGLHTPAIGLGRAISIWTRNGGRPCVRSATETGLRHIGQLVALARFSKADIASAGPSTIMRPIRS
jgi:hypothetical protein